VEDQDKEDKHVTMLTGQMVFPLPWELRNIVGKVGGEIENSRGGPGSGSAGCMIYPPLDLYYRAGIFYVQGGR